MNKKTILILTLISAISIFINLYKKDASPPCFNVDEAAVGYNAYSLLKTGKDEYGTLFPLRLKSFGDYKLPLYSYLSVPFIASFGLNEFGTRALNTFVSFLFPLVIFLLTTELFKKKSIGLIAALFFALSPAIQTIGRQAHEAYLTTFIITLSLWLLIKSINKSKNLYKFLFIFSLFPLSFGYQFSRLWLAFFAVLIIFFTLQKKVSIKYMLICLTVLLIMIVPDIIIRPTRVSNLLFINNPGLALQTAELRSEGGRRLFYNKAAVGLKNYIFGHLSYYSPQFLVSQGDENKRFNYPGISPITAVEYLMIFIGLYYLFKDEQKWRFIILACLIISPVAASLSWVGSSITRTLPLIIFINIICAYGFIRFINNWPKNLFPKISVVLISLIYLFFCFYSWDFYYNHYPKRAMAIRSWQCGNREMAKIVKENYNNYDQFYITKKNSQPYIFLLFYLKYPPEKYQKQANLSPPDEFGFGQVEKFDKFNFKFKYDPKINNALFIGYPDDFNNDKLDQKKLKKIKIGTEEMFYVYSNK